MNPKDLRKGLRIVTEVGRGRVTRFKATVSDSPPGPMIRVKARMIDGTAAGSLLWFDVTAIKPDAELCDPWTQSLQVGRFDNPPFDRPLLTDGLMADLLNCAIRSAGGLRVWARQHDLNPSYVSKIARGEELMGPKVARAIGYVPLSGWICRDMEEGS